MIHRGCSLGNTHRYRDRCWCPLMNFTPPLLRDYRKKGREDGRAPLSGSCRPAASSRKPITQNTRRKRIRWRLLTTLRSCRTLASTLASCWTTAGRSECDVFVLSRSLRGENRSLSTRGCAVTCGVTASAKTPWELDYTHSSFAKPACNSFAEEQEGGGLFETSTPVDTRIREPPGLKL